MNEQSTNKPDFFAIEQAVLNWWKEKDILNKSIESRDENKIKTFYDGPITANGEPHHGHMLTFAMKDVIPRYWSMKGYRVSRSLGWDCQGIPVEYEIEKKLGFTEKKDIEKYGIEKFNELCRQSVQEHMADIIELENLMGRLTNSEEEYATMDKDYIESVWWSLGELYNKGLLYEGFKVVPYSTRAGTTLSNAEVALGGYKTLVDPAITVSFKLDEREVYILAWTTTPWTIPGNLALAVGKEIDYVELIHQDGNSYIVAKDRVESVIGDKLVKISAEFKGKELIGKKYTPPFNLFIGEPNTHQIYAGDHVTADSGTGIVHLAPYGIEDNDIFVRENIKSFDYLDDQGCFTDQVPQYLGLNYRDANKRIINDLKDTNLLFSYEDYSHEMPVCWRTKTPLIYKPITSWYIKVSSNRKELIENNDRITWVPAHAKQGRFGNWLSEIKDWGISRSRYWGTPLPIWKTETGKVKIITSYAELKNLSGQEINDPHRPYVDDITFEIDGELYRRIPDVLDVWYDSGAMPFARFHYPFENKELFEKKFPADYISESVDQTRGWFYSLHAIATLLFDSPAFTSVVMSGYVLDDEGSKLSKSKGNYTSPIPMIQAHGADTIRLNFFSTPIAQGEDTTISENTLRIQKQETILPLWNIFSYLNTYATKKNWQPSTTLVDGSYDLALQTNKLDIWMLTSVQKAILEVSKAMDEYEIPKATKIIKSLINDLSKWYIRRSRERFNDIENTGSITTLYYSFVQLLKLLAPLAPFITEHMYQELVVKQIEGQPESIHLCGYPVANTTYLTINQEIITQMEVVRKICDIGNSIRTNNGLKLKQPLSNIEVFLGNPGLQLLDWAKDVIADELNIKKVLIVNEVASRENLIIDSQESIVIGIDTLLTPELKLEGLSRELIRRIQAERKNMGLNLNDMIKVKVSSGIDLSGVMMKYEETIKKSVNAATIEFVNESIVKEEINLEITILS